MNANFASVFHFLKSQDIEVLGRSESAPPEELREKVLAFIRSGLPTDERERLCAQLAGNPEWVAWMARQIREGTGEGAGRA